MKILEISKGTFYRMTQEIYVYNSSYDTLDTENIGSLYENDIFLCLNKINCSSCISVHILTKNAIGWIDIVYCGIDHDIEFIEL